MTETDILVVRGGPVCLTLAGELGWRGARCTLLEERTAPTAHPKATLLGVRRWRLVHPALTRHPDEWPWPHAGQCQLLLPLAGVPARA
jgi:2-polyprenyl-6-methoxyphenol hydroxylase-like FAD-dependent oxidoreductase